MFNSALAPDTKTVHMRILYSMPTAANTGEGRNQSFDLLRFCEGVFVDYLQTIYLSTSTRLITFGNVFIDRQVMLQQYCALKHDYFVPWTSGLKRLSPFLDRIQMRASNRARAKQENIDACPCCGVDFAKHQDNNRYYPYYPCANVCHEYFDWMTGKLVCRTCEKQMVLYLNSDMRDGPNFYGLWELLDCKSWPELGNALRVRQFFFRWGEGVESGVFDVYICQLCDGPLAARAEGMTLREGRQGTKSTRAMCQIQYLIPAAARLRICCRFCHDFLYKCWLIDDPTEIVRRVRKELESAATEDEVRAIFIARKSREKGKGDRKGYWGCSDAVCWIGNGHGVLSSKALCSGRWNPLA